MKKSESLSDRIKSRIVENDQVPEGVKKISYSQYNVFSECQHRWYLTYGKRMFPFTSSIDTVFGTALHETVQKYLDLLYNKSVKASNEFDYTNFLYDAMTKSYLEEKAKNDGKHFTSKELLEEYYEDGLEIMKFLVKKRKELFDTENQELVGIEIPLNIKVLDALDSIWFHGFIDIILYDKIYDRYVIIDIKTSKEGWRDYQKKDAKKIAQLLLYKHFFSKQFGVAEENIDIKFLIVKRKLWEESQYPQKRTQDFTPANGKAKVKEAVEGITNFVHKCFDYDGKILEGEYPKNPGKNFSNCRFCPFAGSEYCDQKP